MTTRRAIQITTAKVCPINCYPYCPQMKFREIYGKAANMLSLEDFKTCMGNTPKDVTVGFSGFAEPFVNNKAIDMIEYAKSQGRRVVLYSTLVGLKPEDVKRLKEAKLDFISLHLPDEMGVAHIGLTQTYKDTLTLALTNLKIDKYVRTTPNNSVLQLNDRATNCDESKPRHIRGPLACDRLVHPDPVLLPNCDMVLCCMDWQLKHKLGNLLHNTYDEIINGKEFQRVNRQRLAFDGDSICRSCDYCVAISRPSTVVEMGWRYLTDLHSRIKVLNPG